MTDWQFYLINQIKRMFDRMSWYVEDYSKQYTDDGFGNLIICAPYIPEIDYEE